MYLETHGFEGVYVVRQNRYSTRYAVRVPRAHRGHFIRLAKRRGRNVICYPEDFERRQCSVPEGKLRCRYCGRRLSREAAEADHVIPVAKAKRSRFYRALLSLRGITNVNDPRNIVPACHSCNSRKGDKTGIWLIKAVLGVKILMIERIVFGVLGLAIVLIVIFAVTGVIDMTGLVEWVKEAGITIYEFFKGLFTGGAGA